MFSYDALATQYCTLLRTILERGPYSSIIQCLSCVRKATVSQKRKGEESIVERFVRRLISITTTASMEKEQGHSIAETNENIQQTPNTAKSSLPPSLYPF